MSKPQYRHAHQQMRKAWEPTVNAGDAYCAEPVCLLRNRWITPGTPWDLAHDRANGPAAYLGPAHRRCNRSEGARWLAHLRKMKRRPVVRRPPNSNRWVL